MDKILAEAEQFIRQILTIAGNSLSADTIEAVEHYLQHDEYEMAFEGLFIDIMKLEKAPPIDLVESKRMGELLKLNEESVFNDRFWAEFELYISNNS